MSEEKHVEGCKCTDCYTLPKRTFTIKVVVPGHCYQNTIISALQDLLPLFSQGIWLGETLDVSGTKRTWQLDSPEDAGQVRCQQ